MLMDEKRLSGWNIYTKITYINTGAFIASSDKKEKFFSDWFDNNKLDCMINLFGNFILIGLFG